MYSILQEQVNLLKFTPKILRQTNLYFFVQNLSEWHISTRKKHNEAWRCELSFSVEIDDYLKEFKEIHEKYPFGDNYLGRPFFLYDNPWQEVKSIVGENNVLKIQRVFEKLEPYFDIVYAKDEPRLKEWAKTIETPEFANESLNLNKMLAAFYGCPIYDENCIIYLLLSTENKNGGTAGTIDDHSVTLELSRVSTKLKEKVVNILWHELIHLYFRNFALLPFLKEYSGDNWGIISKIDELVASSLLPNGLLSKHKLTEIKQPEKGSSFNTKIDSEKIMQVQEIILPYLQQKKSMNVNLIKKLLKIK